MEDKPTTTVYLHCKICALGGDHPGDHSKIATVDMVRIKAPVSPDMFRSPYPDRVPQDPWPPNTPWARMICPRCHNPIWAFTQDQYLVATAKGGPDEILISEETSDGQKKYRLAKVDQLGIVPEGGRPRGENLYALKARKMLDLYLSGMTLPEIAELFDYHTMSAVHALFMKYYPEEYKAEARLRPRVAEDPTGLPKDKKAAIQRYKEKILAEREHQDAATEDFDATEEGEELDE